jgi:hypothetical protein
MKDEFIFWCIYPILYDSNIISPEYYDFVNKQLVEGKELKLIYRASDDGFKSSDFHRKCDNIDNTLTFIQSEHGNAFGGKTS